MRGGEREMGNKKAYHQPPLILCLIPLQPDNDILVDQVQEERPRVDRYETAHFFLAGDKGA